MAQLIRVPSFVFLQGDIGDENHERPIEVRFYNGSIGLHQEDGQYTHDITIHPDHLNGLFREITRHLPEAIKWLEKK